MQRLVDGERRGGGKQRVAVGLARATRSGRDVAAGAAAILDHDALVQALAQALGDQPRQRVGNAAGREPDDDA